MNLTAEGNPQDVLHTDRCIVLQLHCDSASQLERLVADTVAGSAGFRRLLFQSVFGGNPLLHVHNLGFNWLHVQLFPSA